nr:HlyD family efflux transporter periplasmic adaptor subunit [Hephaestia mangrovi]
MAGGLTLRGVLARRPATALVVHGNVDIREVDLGFRVGGRIADMPVDEGMRIAPGTMLARLDPGPLNDAAAAARAQEAAAAAALDKLRNGNRPQDIAQAEARLTSAQAAAVQATAEYHRRAELVQSGAVSQALYDTAQAQARSADAEVAAARAALSLMRVGARREDISAADAQFRQATALSDKAATDLADATLRAPVAGVILTRAKEPGAIVQPGETVLTETIDRPIRIRAYVGEPDLGRIAPGTKVTVTADGIARTYHGTIGFIASTAEFTPKTVETDTLRTDLVYRFRVIITDPDDALRQGAPVTVTVADARPAATR